MEILASTSIWTVTVLKVLQAHSSFEMSVDQLPLFQFMFPMCKTAFLAKGAFPRNLPIFAYFSLLVLNLDVLRLFELDLSGFFFVFGFFRCISRR